MKLIFIALLALSFNIMADFTIPATPAEHAKIAAGVGKALGLKTNDDSPRNATAEEVDKQIWDCIANTVLRVERNEAASAGRSSVTRMPAR